MRLPNGYGTCYRLPGNRRRPFVVKKTVDGRQKILGYFDTFEHGIAYLSSVNESPLLDDNITFSELFARWKATKYDRLSLSSRKSYDNAYRHCQKLHDMPFRRIRYGHLQDVVDEIQAGYCTQKKCRGLMGQLYKYAIKYDIVTTDYARYVELKPHIRKYKKKPFTVRQRNKLWRAVDTIPAVQDVLILIYTGLRIGELPTKQKYTALCAWSPNWVADPWGVVCGLRSGRPIDKSDNQPTAPLGDGDYHNNLTPSISAYLWVRTA